MNIDYTIDLDGFGFVRSVTNYTSLRDHRLAHRDKLSLKIRFTRSGVAQDVGSLDNDETHFTVKKLNEENEVLSDDSTITTWTKTSSGGDVYYTHDGVVDLDTVELESLIGLSATILVDTQFTWKAGSTVYRSRLLKTTIERALYPATIPPTLATDPARSYVTMLQNVDKLDGDGSGSVALESITTVGLQVPRWFSFVRTTDGRLYYYQLRAGTDAESGTNIRRPDDYDATTNAKVFDYQVAAYSGGTAWGGISGTLSDQTDLQAALDLRATTADLDSHVTNNSNPHNVDKAQVNLANVDNTSDLNKPISTATQTALDAKEETQTAASQAEAEAGTETAIRKWSPLRIAQAIDALAPTGGGGSSSWGGITGTLSDQTDLQVALNAKQPINSYLTQLSSGLGIFDGVVSYTAAGGFVASVFLTAGKGGTGQSSYNIGDLLYAGGTLSLSRLAGNTSTTKKILTQTGNGFASAAPVWDDIPGITIGTTTANGAAGRVLYTDGSKVQQYAVTGTGDVVRATSPTLVTPLLGTPTSGTLTNCTGLPAAGVVGTAVVGATGSTDNAILRANGTGGSTAQGSAATITDAGAPTFYDSLSLIKTGTVDGVTFEAVEDPLNPTVRALYILPPHNSSRIYFGKSGQSAYSLNLLNVGDIENMPSFSVGAGLRVGAVENCYIARVGGTEIGANHPDGNGFDVFQDDSYNTATVAHRALNVHRARGLTLFGTSTSRTNFEGLNLSWNGANYEVKPVAGSAGGTVRAVRYYTTATVWFGGGSGTPESVETAGIGSIYTDTATGNIYRKTSGTGNTGWVTP